MKGQLSLEFLVIVLLLTAYLSVVFTLFSSAKAGLERASDKKAINRISNWIEFISKRPEGTTIRLEILPPPKGYVLVVCGKETIINTRTTSKRLETTSYCKNLNITDSKRLSIERIKGGVGLEVL